VFRDALETERRSAGRNFAYPSGFKVEVRPVFLGMLRRKVGRAM
jgi:hypothetical protein